jgi:hypothetical protein
MRRLLRRTRSSPERGVLCGRLSFALQVSSLEREPSEEGTRDPDDGHNAVRFSVW